MRKMNIQTMQEAVKCHEQEPLSMDDATNRIENVNLWREQYDLHFLCCYFSVSIGRSA